MEEKELYNERELQSDIDKIKQDMEVLKGYGELMKKVKTLREKEV